MPIQVKICDTPDDVARAAALEIAALIRQKPDAVLGLATGSTPVRTYAELVRMNREGLSFSQLDDF